MELDNPLILILTRFRSFLYNKKVLRSLLFTVFDIFSAIS